MKKVVVLASSILHERLIYYKDYLRAELPPGKNQI